MSSHRALLLLQLPVSLSQASTYFIAVTLSSIAILVFLNASTSFLITARIGQREHVGDAVGSLGFADECFALVACPIWGVISDRVGVRFVTVTGYLILASALMGSAQASSVVPGLLLWRVIFSVGAAAK